MFEYKLTAQDAKTKARTGEFKTPHGTLHTPSLAIVGTEGQIKGIPPGVTHTLPLNYSIVNTFHIWTKNIIEKIHDSPKKQVRSPKTVHEYGGFPGIVASDSGGFQVFSLGFGKTHKVGKLAKPDSSTVTSHDDDNPLIITEEGVTFRWNPSSSPTSGRDFDGASDEERTLTPELSMELQHQIGADIMFAFDECTSPFNSKEYVSKSVELTDRWLERCITKHKLLSCHSERSEESRINVNALDPSPDGYRDQDDKQIPMTKNPQALFAIVQGSEWQDLRIKSAKLCAKHDVPGFGIGGSFGNSFGDSKKNMHQVLEWIMPHLPNEKPRHLLGIGQVDDIFEGVERGVDLFDCVIPTREARHKMLYTKRGRIAVKKIKTQNEPIAIDCKCIACSQKITGQQLYELFLQKDPRSFFYATVHNIQFFADLMEEIRQAIPVNRFGELKAEYLRYY